MDLGCPQGRAVRRGIGNVVRPTIAAQIVKKERHTAEQRDLPRHDAGPRSTIVAIARLVQRLRLDNQSIGRR